MGSIDNYDELPMNWVGDWAGRRAALTPYRTALYDSFTRTAGKYALPVARWQWRQWQLPM